MPVRIPQKYIIDLNPDLDTDLKKELGGLTCYRRKGCPDLLWLAPTHKPYFVEVKSGKSPIRPDQKKELRRLDKVGFYCYCVRHPRIDLSQFKDMQFKIHSSRGLDKFDSWKEF